MPTNDTLPEGVSPNDLVEGAKVAHFPSGRATFIGPEGGGKGAQEGPHTLVRPIPIQQPAAPAPYTRADMQRDYPQALQLAMDVLAARLLGLIALVTSCIVWGGVVYAPDPWRIAAAGVFSALVFLPTVALYWRAGMTGEGG